MNKTKIQLTRLDDHMHFEATSTNGNSIQLDGSPKIGGGNKGVRPMETLLMAMAAPPEVSASRIELESTTFT